MNSIATIKTLLQLSLSPIRGNTHEQRLESFYRKQAADYDAFRKKLLHGRQEMYRTVPVPEGAVWYDIGAGTGESTVFMAERLSACSRVCLVDLCPSLLRQARERVSRAGWQHVDVIHGDATELHVSPGTADLVTFSYCLTMIPDWFAAVESAWRLLKVGGHIGVVDFYVSRKYPAPGKVRHGWFTRSFWPVWFASDNVYLNADHLPMLSRKFATVQLDERRGRLPWLPGARVPYYLFIGAKTSSKQPQASSRPGVD